LDRLGYLGFYSEYWNCLLEPDDHEHNEGEDTTECYNCILSRLWQKLSAFEQALWNWYCNNVSRFTIESGLLPAVIVGYKFSERKREMFTYGLNMINRTQEKIAQDQSRPANSGCRICNQSQR
jgi:hypothetical protein